MSSIIVSWKWVFCVCVLQPFLSKENLCSARITLRKKLHQHRQQPKKLKLMHGPKLICQMESDLVCTIFWSGNKSSKILLVALPLIERQFVCGRLISAGIIPNLKKNNSETLSPSMLEKRGQMLAISLHIRICIQSFSSIVGKYTLFHQKVFDRYVRLRVLQLHNAIFTMRNTSFLPLFFSLFFSPSSSCVNWKRD